MPSTAASRRSPRTAIGPWQLLALAVNKPRFDAEAVERMRAQYLANLAYAQRDPTRVAAEQWMALAFAGPSLRPAGQRHARSRWPRSHVPTSPTSGRASSPRTRCAWWSSATSMPKALGTMLDGIFGALPAKAKLTPVTERRAQGRAEAEGDRHERAAVGGALRPSRDGARRQGFHDRLRAQQYRRRRLRFAALCRGAREARPRLRRGYDHRAPETRLGVRRQRGDQERADRRSRWN